MTIWVDAGQLLTHWSNLCLIVCIRSTNIAALANLHCDSSGKWFKKAQQLVHAKQEMIQRSMVQQRSLLMYVSVCESTLKTDSKVTKANLLF